MFKHLDPLQGHIRVPVHPSTHGVIRLPRSSLDFILKLWQEALCVYLLSLPPWVTQNSFVFLLWHNVDRCGSNTVSHIKQSFPYRKQTYNNSSDWLVQTQMKTSWLLWRISADLSCFAALFVFTCAWKTAAIDDYLLSFLIWMKAEREGKGMAV